MASSFGTLLRGGRRLRCAAAARSSWETTFRGTSRSCCSSDRRQVGLSSLSAHLAVSAASPPCSFLRHAGARSGSSGDEQSRGDVEARLSIDCVGLTAYQPYPYKNNHERDFDF